MRSKSKFVTETSHAIHETYYMLRHYNWKRKGKRPQRPMLVFMVTNTKGFYVGGMVDRFKGMISTYAWCKQRNVDFRIRHIYPFELADYLEPAKCDWRIKEGEYTTCIWDASLMRARGEYGRRLVRKSLKHKQIHYYGNRDFLYYINETGDTNYTWGELFHELFRPGEKLAEEIDRKRKEIGRPYISAVFRFQNLLGDFKEYSYAALDSDEMRQALINKCKSGLLDLQKQYPDIPILVTSDSTTFIKEASCLSDVHIIEGKRVHMGCNAEADYDTYLKSFVDFFMLAGSERVFSLGTSEMYPTEFPMYAAKVNGVPFERVLLK